MRRSSYGSRLALYSHCCVRVFACVRSKITPFEYDIVFITSTQEVLGRGPAQLTRAHLRGLVCQGRRRMELLLNTVLLLFALHNTNLRVSGACTPGLSHGCMH